MILTEQLTLIPKDATHVLVTVDDTSAQVDGEGIHAAFRNAGLGHLRIIVLQGRKAEFLKQEDVLKAGELREYTDSAKHFVEIGTGLYNKPTTLPKSEWIDAPVEDWDREIEKLVYDPTNLSEAPTIVDETK